MKATEEYGSWWLPGTDESSGCTGTLTHSIEEGCELALNGRLSEHFGGAYERIFGRTVGGALITLCHAFETESSAGFGSDLSQSTIFANLGYRGGHIDRDPVVPKLWVSFHSFETVLGHQQIKWERPLDSSGRLMNVFQCLPTTTMDCTDGEYQYEFSVNALPAVKWNSVKLETSAGVLITAPEPRLLSQIKREAVRVVETLIETAFDGPSAMSQLMIIDGDSEVDVLVKTRWSEDSDDRHPAKMLFTFAQDASRAALAVKKCKESLTRVGPAHTILYSLRRTPGVPLEQRFLFLVQGLETYHRRTYPSGDRAVVEAILQVVKPALAPDQVGWLNEKLAFAHEPTLKTRILELCPLISEPFRGLLGDGDELARRVAKTRNYFTHYDERSRNGSYEVGEELRIATLRVELLLKLLLAKELGFVPTELSTGWGYFVAGNLKAGLARGH